MTRPHPRLYRTLTAIAFLITCTLLATVLRGGG